jgi:hypothetical protein
MTYDSAVVFSGNSGYNPVQILYTCSICNKRCQIGWLVGFMVLNATFNNISVISWWAILLVEETGVLGESDLTVASHWQTLSHNVVSSIPRHERALFSMTPVSSNRSSNLTEPPPSATVWGCVWIQTTFCYCSKEKKKTFRSTRRKRPNCRKSLTNFIS